MTTFGASLTGFNPSAFNVFSPVSYQVIQRVGTVGDIPIRGNVGIGSHDIEANFNGGSFVTIEKAATGVFSGVLAAQPQGQGTLIVRQADNHVNSVSISIVGIGDIFLIIGQSNASGRGSQNQVYSGTFKACLFGNNYYWQDSIDPIDSLFTSGIPTQRDVVSNDSNAIGSYWNLLATLIMAGQNCPVAFVPCPLGGTSIAQWQKPNGVINNQSLYGSSVLRAIAVGGNIRAILMHDGETDMGNATTQVTFLAGLQSLAASYVADLPGYVGMKLYPCKIQKLGPSGTFPDANQAAINNAIGQAWTAGGNIGIGADLTNIDLTAGAPCNNGDEQHINGNACLQTAANDWYTAFTTSGGLYNP